MKEQIKAPEKIQLSDEEIEEENTRRSEGCEKWNKGKCAGNQQWREGNWDSNQCLGQKEEINIQQEKNEETRIQKHEERLRNLQDILKHSNIQIIGCLLYTSDAADEQYIV